jgi:hypothetical protein
MQGLGSNFIFYSAAFGTAESISRLRSSGMQRHVDTKVSEERGKPIFRVSIYQTTVRHIQEGHDLNTYCHGNLRYL